ncbi:MAG TPA: hypothetical protein VKR31_00975 [Rhizomicrobium sp.]|nr:hypothetical protein [Rhizomicrobium sp.]
MSRSDWASERRQDYIDWRLSARGTLCREDIISVFGISPAQASLDINRFIALYPGAMDYDKSAKRYVPARSPYRAKRGMDDPNVRRAITLLANAGSPMGWT